ncbi:RHS repeat-associated core domain-containing protein [Pseudomonas sp. ITEM 17296]|uniref:RHS repeat-associated core domain-containing protein n=1 Tax=Pseudomonas sp. ITEM 17296 TaxID=2790281 RepID=UPI00268E4711
MPGQNTSAIDRQPFTCSCFTPYGYSTKDLLLSFNGQYRHCTAKFYLLGNGYRAYNPGIMRFQSPDAWSPFGAGSFNAYAYCANDPINKTDPSGHKFIPSALRWPSDQEYRRGRFNVHTSPNLNSLPTPVVHQRRPSLPNNSITQGPEQSALPSSTNLRPRSNSWTYTEPLQSLENTEVDSAWKHISMTRLQEHAWRSQFANWTHHAQWDQFPTETYRYQTWRNNMSRLINLGDDILLDSMIGRIAESSQVREIRRSQHEQRNYLTRKLTEEPFRLTR